MKSGKGLRVLRAEQDITQSKLARTAGMSHTRYWQIEKGEGLAPTKDEREAVAAALNVKVSAIAWPAGALERAS